MPQQTFLFKATWHPILYLPVFLISFLFKCISFRPSVHQRCNSLPTTVSSPLSSQTTTVGSTRAQSSSSTQQPGDRRTALLSLRLTWHTALLSPPAVGLLLSLKLTWHAAPLFPAVGLLLSLRLVCHTPLLPLQWIDSPFQLVDLAVLPLFGNRSALLAT